MRILLADDQDLVRDAIVALLAQEADFEIVAVVDLHAALDQIGAGFDVVLLDYAMPGMDGLAGFQKMKAATQSPVALLSGSANRDVAQDALDMGAAGFLPKTMGGRSLANAIRFMAAGEIFAPVKFMSEVPEDTRPDIVKTLTAREMQILDGLCRGLSNKEIAREVDLQEVTVKLHVKTTCRKLGAKNRTHAAVVAKDIGIF